MAAARVGRVSHEVRRRLSFYYETRSGNDLDGNNDVIAVDKQAVGDSEDRVICECGWPLKEWVGYRAYVFTRRDDARTASIAST